MRRSFVALAAALLLAGCTGEPADDGGPAAAPSTAVAPLTPCPEQPEAAAVGAQRLPALVFECPGGGSLDLARAPGVPMVVNLWGSWCPPCREEMPVLQEFAELAGDDVRMVGVISKDGLPQAASFAEDAGVTFPSAFDGEGELMAELGLNALPFTYFVDAGGALVHTEAGPVGSLDELRGLVAQHLGVQL
ncbi:TlpA family protein disulfide reductase [Blastococcus saxobsidens]|uniref:Thiol-disulfide isomerase-like thioredoxin n=1 Tax=Blastococcus saxobsidens (strain DD2) TaxID=1146883 RepID=H6RPR1_BLASD|nr:TlpA disulfide reductase family protein [Blastococcus saxobsidens]CCG01480.1 Thiol-disulfide isomerase-like thioredoxin [Blastococcus saxobsidens DD2]